MHHANKPAQNSLRPCKISAYTHHHQRDRERSEPLQHRRGPRPGLHARSEVPGAGIRSNQRGGRRRARTRPRTRGRKGTTRSRPRRRHQVHVHERHEHLLRIYEPQRQLQMRLNARPVGQARQAEHVGGDAARVVNAVRKNIKGKGHARRQQEQHERRVLRGRARLSGCQHVHVKVADNQHRPQEGVKNVVLHAGRAARTELYIRALKAVQARWKRDKR